LASLVSQMPFEKELEAARRAALRAGEIALGYFARGVAAEVKSDLSPVTAADRECERVIAALLNEAFPDDGLLGEEGARKEPRGGRRWIIDPIDGTRDFVRGLDTWGVMIALEAGGEAVVGVVNLPVQTELYCAARGAGAYRNDQRLSISAIADPAQALLCVNGFNIVTKLPFAPRLLEWMSRFWAVRSMGGCRDAMLIASGRAEVWIEPAAHPWDLAPLQIIAEEAGARFFNFDGGHSIHGGNCILCVPSLDTEVREFLGI